MIHDALIFLRNSLNIYLAAGLDPTETVERVKFLDGVTVDALPPETSSIYLHLVNIEEEKLLRPPDAYTRLSPDGQGQRIHPAIRLNLYVLFIAHFPNYEDSLRALSDIIQFFQKNRRIDHLSSPTLSEAIDKLVIELMTLPFAEQNEVWNALRAPYRPSVLYKIGLIVFQDADGIDSPRVQETSHSLSPTNGA